MEEGVLEYGEYDGEQSEPIRVDRDRESQTRVKKHAEKAEKNRVSTARRCSQATIDLDPKHQWAQVNTWADDVPGLTHVHRRTSEGSKRRSGRKNLQNFRRTQRDS